MVPNGGTVSTGAPPPLAAGFSTWNVRSCTRLRCIPVRTRGPSGNTGPRAIRVDSLRARAGSRDSILVWTYPELADAVYEDHFLVVVRCAVPPPVHGVELVIVDLLGVLGCHGFFSCFLVMVPAPCAEGRCADEVLGDFDLVVKKLRQAHGVDVEVYGARKLTAASLIQAATRFVAIEGPLLLSS